jgi:hypothetical protein
MNARIEYLFKHAGGYVEYDDNGQILTYTQDLDVEKFAELIVLECSELCYTSHLEDGDAHAMNILDHFDIDGAKHWK